MTLALTVEVGGSVCGNLLLGGNSLPGRRRRLRKRFIEEVPLFPYRKRGTVRALSRRMPDDADRFPRPKTLLIHEAAERLGVSRRTVYYRISDGRLQTIRTRCGSQRVLLSSIEALLRQEVETPRRGRLPARPADSQAETLPLQIKALSGNP
jgi:excisionase family DNA binding protein